ncbi:MAG TPA: hypothetical protein VGJ95_17055, partial [Pseudonocardiaceae bacterium]
MNEVQAMAKAGEAVGTVLGTAVLATRRATVGLGRAGATASRRAARRTRRGFAERRTAPQMEETIVDSAHRAKKSIKKRSRRAQDSVAETLSWGAHRAQESLTHGAHRAQESLSHGAHRAQESLTHSAVQARESLAQSAVQARESVAQGAAQARESLASNVVKARRELAAAIEPPPVRRRRRWPLLLILAAIGTVGFALSRRMLELRRQSAPRAIEPAATPERPTPGASGVNGVVPRSTDVRVSGSEAAPAAGAKTFSPKTMSSASTVEVPVGPITETDVEQTPEDQ